ncbi:MAG: MBL fold metallo-hydrolase [Clostridia bacterium]|nr:MBL fold metallo-hydrolase [Clostridia bacterium]
MKLEFIGAAHEVTGSCTLVSACGKRFLVDCGMEQGKDLFENAELPVAPGSIDFILLTHAHIDHSGKIPELVARGYSAPVYATGATHELCKIMLMDSAHIAEQEAVWRNRKAKRSGKELYVPPYTVQDAQKALTLFRPCSYEKTVSPANGISVRFIDAGHLLGSASIEITAEENGGKTTVVFSGDVGNIDRPLINDPVSPKKADYLVIESTYGDRLHGERSDYVSQLVHVLQDTFDRGGNVVIPAFAVGRTQELLYLLRIVKERGLIHGHGDFPVYVDSPLAVSATEIYSGEMEEYYDPEAIELLSNGINPIKFPGLRVAVTSEESIRINQDPEPKVILSASGMCEAGRIRHHLKHNLWRKESTVLFVGYQTEGTLGRLLIDGVKDIKLFGEEIKVNAAIEQMDGISGHADRDMLLSWIGGFETKPKRVFVNHGSDTVCDIFANAVEERFSIPAMAPYSGAVFDTALDSFTQEGNRRPIEKKPAKERESAMYQKLTAAIGKLAVIAERWKNGSNKDLSKFADQILALCKKWDR